MNAIQQFFEMVTHRFYEIEEAKLERAEILVNLKAALRTGEITQAQHDELVAALTAPAAQTKGAQA